MVITTFELIALAIFWSIFYFFLSHFIAGLSRDAWIEYIRSSESDEMLLEALDPIVNEIEDRMHDKMQAFQDSFFGSVGQMVKKGKELDPMNAVRKAAARGDWTSLLVEYAANKSGLGKLLPSESPDTDEKGGGSSDFEPLLPKKITELDVK